MICIYIYEFMIFQFFNYSFLSQFPKFFLKEKRDFWNLKVGIIFNLFLEFLINLWYFKWIFVNEKTGFSCKEILISTIFLDFCLILKFLIVLLSCLKLLIKSSELPWRRDWISYIGRLISFVYHLYEHQFKLSKITNLSSKSYETRKSSLNQVKQICSLVFSLMHEISINFVEWVGTEEKSRIGSARIFRRQIGLDLF